jgi:hypothetical protein
MHCHTQHRWAPWSQLTDEATHSLVVRRGLAQDLIRCVDSSQRRIEDLLFQLGVDRECKANGINDCLLLFRRRVTRGADCYGLLRATNSNGRLRGFVMP